MRIGETPVPIPNTKVKTYPAEDTAGATLWESRWLPNLKKKKELNSDKIKENFLYGMTGQPVRKAEGNFRTCTLRTSYREIINKPFIINKTSNKHIL